MAEGNRLPSLENAPHQKTDGEFFIKYVKWFQLPDIAPLPLRRWLFPSYESCDMYHSIEKPIDSLPLIFNTIMSFCLLHTKCKASCLKQIMPVKFLISFSKKQLFLRWFWMKSDKSLIERKFSVFLYLLSRDSEKWFKLIHFILE